MGGVWILGCSEPWWNPHSTVKSLIWSVRLDGYGGSLWHPISRLGVSLSQFSKEPNVVFLLLFLSFCCLCLLLSIFLFLSVFIFSSLFILCLSIPSSLFYLHPLQLLFPQLHPAIPEVKGPTSFICYWWIFVIANIEN